MERRVQPQENGGTRFRVWLPFGQLRSRQRPEIRPRSRSACGTNRRNEKREQAMIRQVLFALAFSGSAFAQTPDIPRTREGRPDFQGIWESNGLAANERLPGASGLVVGDEEARKLSDAFWAKRFGELYDPHENLGMAREL